MTWDAEPFAPGREPTHAIEVIFDGSEAKRSTVKFTSSMGDAATRLYLKDWAYRRLGSPDKVRVRVTAAK